MSSYYYITKDEMIQQIKDRKLFTMQRVLNYGEYLNKYSVLNISLEELRKMDREELINTRDKIDRVTSKMIKKAIQEKLYNNANYKDLPQFEII